MTRANGNSPVSTLACLLGIQSNWWFPFQNNLSEACYFVLFGSQRVDMCALTHGKGITAHILETYSYGERGERKRKTERERVTNKSKSDEAVECRPVCVPDHDSTSHTFQPGA